MKLVELQSRIGAAETLLKAMASEPRLILLRELTQGECTVTELQTPNYPYKFAFINIVTEELGTWTPIPPRVSLLRAEP